jgi:hypothetical protein
LLNSLQMKEKNFRLFCGNVEVFSWSYIKESSTLTYTWKPIKHDKTDSHKYMFVFPFPKPQTKWPKLRDLYLKAIGHLAANHLKMPSYSRTSELNNTKTFMHWLNLYIREALSFVFIRKWQVSIWRWERNPKQIHSYTDESLFVWTHFTEVFFIFLRTIFLSRFPRNGDFSWVL